MIAGPSLGHATHSHRDLAAIGELERVRQQVLEDLLQRLESVVKESGNPSSSSSRRITLFDSATWWKVRCTLSRSDAKVSPRRPP